MRPRGALNNCKTHHLPSRDVVLYNMHTTLSQVKKLLVAAQARQKAYADKSRSPHALKKGQQLLLSTRNFKFKEGVKKLHPKYVGPYKTPEMVGQNAAKLDLPAAYSKLHPVFHVSHVWDPSFLVSPVHACCIQEQ